MKGGPPGHSLQGGAGAGHVGKGGENVPEDQPAEDTAFQNIPVQVLLKLFLKMMLALSLPCVVLPPCGLIKSSATEEPQATSISPKLPDSFRTVRKTRQHEHGHRKPDCCA